MANWKYARRIAFGLKISGSGTSLSAKHQTAEHTDLARYYLGAPGVSEVKSRNKMKPLLHCAFRIPYPAVFGTF